MLQKITILNKISRILYQMLKIERLCSSCVPSEFSIYISSHMPDYSYPIEKSQGKNLQILTFSPYEVNSHFSFPQPIQMYIDR